MRLLLAACFAAIAVSACASAPVATSSDIERVLANPARSQADRERDARDKPAEVFALAKFRQGDTVADILGGGGYNSEILSGIVGPTGHVLLVNNPGYDGFGKKGWTERLADNRLPNVQHVVGPTDALGMGDDTLDGAVIVMSYHDLYWVDEKEGWTKIDAGQFLDQIARALKPGGVLLVVDHSAKQGTGSSAAQTLHRIDEQFAIADFRKHGLEWVAAMPYLRNPDDDRSKLVFDPAIRGKTDRFVHLYRKPG
ncbi:class I SAM-dependent methyltransferase [Pseudoluteimonas lycopersici]|uniref:Class I SAM-dependent methyltransferase n=1 Tax=Pseudoluteimonas lycopersici TaxID=1324796 RepID=A0A516V5L8_9GAMM|nr:class I SAM-dependent methyltransferase [Lysobacter lycopersici]QDQ73829.1 class I SAM-dependent methyltransferase [Lysobacter lycopersici]